MEFNESKDKLVIETENDPIKLNIVSGELERNYSFFDFDSDRSTDISGYSLVIDTDNLCIEEMRELENIVNNPETFYEIKLKLEGAVKKGIAKIAQNFGAIGFNLDLEVHE